MSTLVRPFAMTGFALLLVVGTGVTVRADGSTATDGWRPLFNGKDFSGWKPRNPDARKTWVACDDVRLDPANPDRFIPVGKGGSADAVMLCGDDGRGSDLMTVENFDDY